MIPRTFTPAIVRDSLPRGSRPWPFLALSLLLALGAPVRSQEPAPAESVVDAARAAREQRANSTQAVAKIFTTDDLSPQIPSPTPGAPTSSAPAASTSSAAKPGEPPPAAAGCGNPEDEEKLKVQLQEAQEQREQLRRELSPQAPVISGGNLDTSNFKPGNSGFNLGSPPLSQTQPQSPARLEQIAVDEHIEALQRALRISCDSPKAAEIQRNLDAAEQQLSLSQRQFDLDRAAFYSQPNYSEDIVGKSRLDAEQQQLESLQAEVERLKDHLAAQNPASSNQ